MREVGASAAANGCQVRPPRRDDFGDAPRSATQSPQEAQQQPPGVARTFTFRGIGVDVNLPWRRLQTTFGLRSALRFTDPVVEDEYVRYLYIDAMSRRFFFSAATFIWPPLLIAVLNATSDPLAMPLLIALHGVALVTIASRIAVAMHYKKRCLDRPSTVFNAYCHEKVDMLAVGFVAFVLVVVVAIRMLSIPSPFLFLAMHYCVIGLVPTLSPWRCVVTIPTVFLCQMSVMGAALGFEVASRHYLLGVVTVFFNFLFPTFAVFYERNCRLQFARTVKGYCEEEERLEEVGALANVIASLTPEYVLRSIVAGMGRFSFASPGVTLAVDSTGTADPRSWSAVSSKTQPVAVALVYFGASLSPEIHSQRLAWASQLAETLGVQLSSPLGDIIHAVAKRWESGRCGTMAVCSWAMNLCNNNSRGGGGSVDVSERPQRRDDRDDEVTPNRSLVVRAIVDLSHQYRVWAAATGSLSLRSTFHGFGGHSLNDACKLFMMPPSTINWAVTSVYVTKRLAGAFNRIMTKVQRAAARHGLLVRPIPIHVVVVVDRSRRPSATAQKFEGDDVGGPGVMLPLRVSFSLSLARATITKCRGKTSKQMPMDMLFGKLSDPSSSSCAALQHATVIGKPFRAVYIGSASLSEAASGVRPPRRRLDSSGCSGSLPESNPYQYPVVGNSGAVPMNTAEELQALAARLTGPVTATSSCWNKFQSFAFPSTFPQRHLEAMLRRRMSVTFRVACLLPFLAAAGLVLLRLLERGYVLPADLRSAEGLDDSICYLGVVLGAVSVLFVRQREKDAFLDALCCVTPFAMFALSRTRVDASVNAAPLLVIIFTTITFSLRHDIKLQFLLFALMVMPSMVAFSRESLVECVTLFVDYAAFYILCVRQESARRRVFLTSEALWQRVAAASRIELQLYRACVADYAALLPGIVERGQPPAPSGGSPRWYKLNAAIVVRVEWDLPSPPSRRRKITAHQCQREAISTSMERQGRRLLRYLPSLVFADASGDAWLIISVPDSSSSSSVSPRPSAAVLACLDHIPLGLWSAAMDAYILISRLQGLMAQVSNELTANCAAHVGPLTVFTARSERETAPELFSRPNSLWVSGDAVSLTRRLCREVSTNIGQPPLSRRGAALRCAATSSFICQLNGALEQTRKTNDKLFTNNVKRMQLATARSRSGSGCVNAKHFVRSNSSSSSTTGHGLQIATAFFPGDLVSWIHDGLIFAACQRWVLREITGPCRVVFVSLSRDGSDDQCEVPPRHAGLHTATAAPPLSSLLDAPPLVNVIPVAETVDADIHRLGPRGASTPAVDAAR